LGGIGGRGTSEAEGKSAAERGAAIDHAQHDGDVAFQKKGFAAELGGISEGGGANSGFGMTYVRDSGFEESHSAPDVGFVGHSAGLDREGDIRAGDANVIGGWLARHHPSSSMEPPARAAETIAWLV
jgi:hypothetical protein